MDLEFCTVVQNLGMVIEDTYGDSDRNPDYRDITGDVTFTPVVTAGQSYKVSDEFGRRKTVVLGRIRARIVDGMIWHEGSEGISLYAGGENSNPDKVVYRVEYSNLMVNRESVTLNGLSFEAVPGETIDLTDVTPVAGVAPAGIIKGDPFTYDDFTPEQLEDLTSGLLDESVQSTIDAVVVPVIESARDEAINAVGSVAIPRVTTAGQEVATLGPELITSAGWSFGEGWSGDFASGFTKTPGGTGTLRWTPDFDPGTDLYLVEWQWDGSSTTQDVYSGYDVYFGNGYAGITYQGAAPSNASYSRAIKSEINRGFDLIPWESFEGRIHSVSVRRVVSPAAVGVGWRTSGGTRGGELRFGDRNASSVFLGIDSGKYNYSGSRNAAVGAFAMAENVSGFFNAALGFGALQRNTNGTRNVGVGYNALAANTAGDRNIGVGPFALTRNTTGQRNVAVGTDVLWRNETGSDNVGIGYLTATELRTGFSNVAIGKYAMRHTHGATFGGTQHNIAIGEESLSRVLGEGSVAIGHRAAAEYSGNNVVAIGNAALEYNTTAGSQTAVGYQALRYNTGGRNTAIGNASLSGVEGESTGQRNVAVGDNAGTAITSGSQNTIIGPSAGPNISTESRNILIGFATYVQSGRDDFLNIGNVLYGDLATKKFGVGMHTPTARLHLLASDGTAGTAPIKINGGTLLTTPEVGALEFSAGKLYFTTSTGTRKEIQFVA